MKIRAFLLVFLMGFTLSACKPEQNDQDQKEQDAESTLAYGKQIFNKCAMCHNLTPDGPRKAGPHLAQILGRRAGQVQDFPYSAKLKASGLMWDRYTLKKFIHNPRELVPGNRMAFAGINDEADIDALLAYIEANSKLH